MNAPESPDRSADSPAPAENSAASGCGSCARRRFLGGAATLAMTGGLAGGYGAFGAMAVRYMYPASGTPMVWLYVSPVAEMAKGDSIAYRAPDGRQISVTRMGEGAGAEDFIALSSICPHLGCAVHWEPANNRYFCPCHNGAFDPSGKATEGPPAKAGQSLFRFPLKVENGLLFIEAPVPASA